MQSARDVALIHLANKVVERWKASPGFRANAPEFRTLIEAVLAADAEERLNDDGQR